MNDIWVCTKCKSILGVHDKQYAGLCESCDKEPKDKEIHEHSFMIIPKSGANKGIAYWKCVTCNKVVQST